MNNSGWSLTIEVCEENFEESDTPTSTTCANAYFCFENLIEAVKFIELYSEYSYLKNEYILQEL